MKDLYDEKYFLDRMAYSQRTILRRRLAKTVQAQPGQRLLDVGCGTGVLVQFFRSIGVDAIGTDFSEAAQKLFFDSKYFVLADAKSLPFKDGEFDIVVSSDLLEHIVPEDLDKVASEMLRVGKKVYARVGTRAQPPYHLTIKSKQWWYDRFQGRIIILT